MYSSLTVLCTFVGYMLFLFLVALSIERTPASRRSVSRNPMAYSLSLAVYCTTWTYYGSVGKAATSGMLFITIYLGPTLAMIVWWLVLRKMIRIKDRFHITSIVDFISARYDRSQLIAALATVAALIGTMPYIALQLKAATASFSAITTGTGNVGAFLAGRVDVLMVVLMTVFTIMFGVRRLDPTERHQGMIAAVAVESLVKLGAFLACGLFITYGVHDGFGDLFAKFAASEAGRNSPLTGHGVEHVSYITWATYLILAASAFMFLPRQFHVAVIENCKEKHLLTSMWLFPLYLLLINLFVAPIAMDGMLSGLPVDQADTYVLKLPMAHGRRGLSLAVYLGGVSAAMSMIMISAMTLSTMVTNHLVLPGLGRLKPFRALTRNILRVRWAAVALVLLTGLWFERSVGESYMLVNMGMISFAAALQFAPAILGGIFWLRGSKAGAFIGLSVGNLLWFYTLFLPALCHSGWINPGLLEHGPWGLEFLKPEALFGLTALDNLSHSVFWSMLFNVTGYVLGSLAWGQTNTEEQLAREFRGALDLLQPRGEKGATRATIDIRPKIDTIRELMRRYVSDRTGRLLVRKSLSRTKLRRKSRISLLELAELQNDIEKTLAGMLGSAAAHRAMQQSGLFTDQETTELASLYADILAGLKLNPRELKRKIDYYQEREALMEKHASELERRVKERTAELEEANREMESFSYSVSHDLRTPLRSIDGFSQVLLEDYQEVLDDAGRDFLGRVRRASQHMGDLIDDLLHLSRVSRVEPNREPVDLSEMVRRIFQEMQKRAPKRDVEIIIQPDVTAACDIRLIHILLDNLAGNAWKFTATTPHPRIEFGVRQEKNEKVYFFRDNGVGFNMEYADKLFKAFNRLHTDDEFEGTGIGLAIVDRVARRHGGWVKAQGAPDKGAHFSFTLQPS